MQYTKHVDFTEFLPKNGEKKFRNFTASQCENHIMKVKNEKFILTEKIFRQINSLVIYLVKPLFSRKFWQK